MGFVQFLVIAFIAEAVWETLKLVWQDGKLSIDRIGAVIVGLLLAIGTQLDLLQLIDIPTYIPYMGIVLTGLLISRGANFAHDFLEVISSLYQDLK
jgi:hypothetical protein